MDLRSFEFDQNGMSRDVAEGFVELSDAENLIKFRLRNGFDISLRS